MTAIPDLSIWDDVLFIDAEARSAIDIKEVGDYVYCEHESTSCLCACWAIGLEMEPRLWTPDMDIPVEWIEHTGRWAAHNKDMELMVFKRLIAGWARKSIYAMEWIDTATLASIAGLPRKLDDVAKALHLEVQKASKAAMLRLCKPQKATKKRPQGGFIERDEEPETYKALYAYCAIDVKLMQLIVKRLPPYQYLLPPAELRLEEITNAMNERGVPVDLEALAIAEREVAAHKEALTKEFAELMPGILPKSPIKVAEELGLPNVAAATTRDARKTATGRNARVLDLLQDINRSSLGKLESLRQRTTRDSKLHGTMLFHGAGRTGRFSSLGFQIQNLISGYGDFTDTFFELAKQGLIPEFFSSVSAAWSNAMKGFLWGGLWSGDFAQIEPRVLNRLACQWDALDVFAKDGDPYRRLAAAVFKKPENQVTKDDKMVLGRLVKSERFLGKQGELSCGYQVGPDGFIRNMKEKFDIELTYEEAKAIVDGYRALHPNVVKLWYAVDDLAKYALSRQAQTWQFSDKCPGLAFRCFRSWLCFKIPGGRVLWYFEPRMTASERGMKIQYWGRNPKFGNRFMLVDTYGGKFVENATQAVAREVMAQAMIRLEDKGEELLFSVHDDMIGRDLGTDAEEIAEECRRPPSFWKDGSLPLKIEVHRTLRFQK